MLKCENCEIVIDDGKHTDIIFDLIYLYVKKCGEKYKEYFEICDSDVCDGTLTIFVDCFNKWGFNNEREYVDYLQIFKEKSEIFVSELELPTGIKMSGCFQEYDVEDETILDYSKDYYESYILNFKF